MGFRVIFNLVVLQKLCLSRNNVNFRVLYIYDENTYEKRDNLSLCPYLRHYPLQRTKDLS